MREVGNVVCPTRQGVIVMSSSSSSSGGLVGRQSCPASIVVVRHRVWKVGEVGEGVVVIVRPPRPRVVVGHRMRVRASTSTFGANGPGGKASARESSSDHPSSTSRASRRQLVVVVWWGRRCRCCCRSSLTVLVASSSSSSGRGLVNVVSPQAADDGCAVW